MKWTSSGTEVVIFGYKQCYFSYLVSCCAWYCFLGHSPVPDMVESGGDDLYKIAIDAAATLSAAMDDQLMYVLDAHEKGLVLITCEDSSVMGSVIPAARMSTVLQKCPLNCEIFISNQASDGSRICIGASSGSEIVPERDVTCDIPNWVDSCAGLRDEIESLKQFLGVGTLEVSKENPEESSHHRNGMGIRRVYSSGHRQTDIIVKCVFTLDHGHCVLLRDLVDGVSRGWMWDIRLSSNSLVFTRVKLNVDVSENRKRRDHDTEDGEYRKRRRTAHRSAYASNAYDD